MTYQWVSTDTRTGRVLADLPDLSVSTVTQVLGAYTSASASLPLPTAPEGWERATLHGGATLVLLDDAGEGQPVPVWGGGVTARRRGDGDIVSLSLATPEAALDRFYVGDVTYTATGQNAIVADLIARYVTTMPFRVVQVGGAGTLRDRTYMDASDRTVLSAIIELSGVQGGPEWTVGWEWRHDPERITPVLYVGARIGSSPIAGLAPAASFDMPGSVTKIELTEDFTAGKGATDVMAVSSGVEAARPQSPHQVAADVSRPGFEYRFTPSTSISDPATLTAHAQRALARMVDGAVAMSLTAAVESAPRLGVDWFIGDDVGFDVGALGQVPAFPSGLVGTARCIGWELSLVEPLTVTPIVEMRG